MNFDEFGNLLPGEHNLTLEQFKNNFVEDVYFEKSTTRTVIHNNFSELINELINLDLLDGLTKIWIDGSFSTQKLNPNDIDLILFYDFASEKKEKVEYHLDLCKFKMKNTKKCHFNCLTDYTNDENFNDDDIRIRTNELTSRRLVRYFEYDKKDRKKGYISIQIHTDQGGV